LKDQKDSLEKTVYWWELVPAQIFVLLKNGLDETQMQVVSLLLYFVIEANVT